MFNGCYLKKLKIGSCIKILIKNTEIDATFEEVYKNCIIVKITDEKIDNIKFNDKANINIILDNVELEYTAYVLSVRKKENANTLVMGKIEEISKKVGKERREYYRLKYKMKIGYKFLGGFKSDKNYIVPKLYEFKEGNMVDISAGGMKFYSQEEPVGSNAIVSLCLPEKINIYCEIVRVEKNENNDKNYSVAVKFTNLKDIERQSIVKFVYSNKARAHSKNNWSV